MGVGESADDADDAVDDRTGGAACWARPAVAVVHPATVRHPAIVAASIPPAARRMAAQPSRTTARACASTFSAPLRAVSVTTT